jgi:hypothetical protein
MKLMTKEIEKKLPKLYSTDGKKNKKAIVKYFTPDAQWTWYGIEYDKDTKTFFGLVCSIEKEFGYFSLDELKKVKGPLGLPIERDLYFEPTLISEL